MYLILIDIIIVCCGCVLIHCFSEIDGNHDAIPCSRLVHFSDIFRVSMIPYLAGTLNKLDYT